MQLILQQLMPVPMRDSVLSVKSGIWRQTLSFSKGDQVFVEAPSGTGKTTLIHMLYALRTDYEGELLWDKREVKSIDAERLSELRAKHISVIFQDMRLFPELTAWENLEIKRTLCNTVNAEQVGKWLHKLGIGHKKDALASTLSYGEQQRISIIRALLQPFDWLLMDEPFSHLDKENIKKSIALISEVVQENKAGLILADLDENHYFNYTKTIML
ncbi:MAG: ATP-binding cassette domain-containing protein [Bacteroidota bacterium]